MRYLSLLASTVTGIVALAALTIHADPLIHLKNNAKHMITVQPVGRGLTFGSTMTNPGGEYTFGDVKSGAKIDGILINYCSNTVPDTAPCDLSKYAQQAQFDFVPDPKTQRYYVKFTVDKDDIPSLAPQKGSILGRSSSFKHSLSGNIKENQIKPQGKAQKPNAVNAAPQAAAKPAATPKKDKPTSKPASKPVTPVRQELSPIDKLIAKTYSNDELEKYYVALNKQGFSGKFIDPTATYNSEKLKDTLVSLINEAIQKIKGSEIRQVKLYWIVLPAYYKSKQLQAMMKSKDNAHPSLQENIEAADDALRTFLAEPMLDEYGSEVGIDDLVREFEQKNR